MQAIVDSYKTANMQIANMCRTISQKLLIKVDEKRVYENLEFDDAQVRNGATRWRHCSEIFASEFLKIMIQLFRYLTQE